MSFKTYLGLDHEDEDFFDCSDEITQSHNEEEEEEEGTETCDADFYDENKALEKALRGWFDEIFYVFICLLCKYS